MIYIQHQYHEYILHMMEGEGVAYRPVPHTTATSQYRNVVQT